MTIKEAVETIQMILPQGYPQTEEAIDIVINAVIHGYTVCKVVDVISDASDYAPGMKLAVIMEE